MADLLSKLNVLVRSRLRLPQVSPRPAPSTTPQEVSETLRAAVEQAAVQAEAAVKRGQTTLAQRLDEETARLEQLAAAVEARLERQRLETSAPASTAESAETDEELNQRLQRLSKP
jgi:hypothetical protein